MIGTLKPEEKIEWSGKVQALTHSYNCSCSQIAGYSPFFLFYERESRIPIDVEIGHPDQRKQESLPNFCKATEGNFRKSI